LRAGAFDEGDGEVSGKYTEEFEEDREKIHAFLGEDFLSPGPKTQEAPSPAKKLREEEAS
jgi:hypothetical protein